MSCILLKFPAILWRLVIVYLFCGHLDTLEQISEKASSVFVNACVVIIWLPVFLIADSKTIWLTMGSIDSNVLKYIKPNNCIVLALQDALCSGLKPTIVFMLKEPLCLFLLAVFQNILAHSLLPSEPLLPPLKLNAKRWSCKHDEGSVCIFPSAGIIVFHTVG